MRSMLFAGATRPDLVAKIARSAPDAAIVDLEDAVPDYAKTQARQALAGLLASIGAGPRLFVRVNAPQALPGRGPDAHKASIQSTEQTYALMMHISQSLGVNCTFCHNTHNFGTWDVPARVTAWHGIRMVRDLNNAYLVPLGPTLPAARHGPAGDGAKVFCATCHQGANKPLGGAVMAPKYAGLKTVALAAPKAVPLPPPVSEAKLSVLYFDVGSPALQESQAAGLAQLVATLKKETRATATISGFHSASGTLAANQELAKQRAFAVRDALVASGIDARRVKLEKPQQTSGNVAGEDPSARRVEVRTP